MTKFLCGECIHNSDKGGGCLIPKNLGYVDNCNRYLPKDRPIVQTNEEYLRSANVNDMARCIATKLLELARHEYGIYDVVDYATVFEWLKQPHTFE